MILLLELFLIISQKDQISYVDGIYMWNISGNLRKKIKKKFEKNENNRQNINKQY